MMSEAVNYCSVMKQIFVENTLLGNEHYICGYNIRKKRALLEIRFGGRQHRTSVGVEFTKA